MLNPVIYIRASLAEKDELTAAHKYFTCLQHRTVIRENELVVSRYSALPFNKELCEDIANLGAVPINSHRQHSYVADLQNWYYDLEAFTPKTWFSLENLPKNTSFVLKGQTNSKKLLWNTHCFAADKNKAYEVYDRLSQDSLIGYQQIYVREYVPLKQLAVGLNGLPISEEYRFFILDKKILASSFYWSSHTDELIEKYCADDVPVSFLNTVIETVGDNIRFWVVDIAKTADNKWIVIELNDGCQSGLSDINPDFFYNQLHAQLCVESDCDHVCV